MKLLSAAADTVRTPLSSTSLRQREILLSGLLLALLALVVYLPHIVRGGWYLDDWMHVAVMSEAGGPLDVIRSVTDLSYRPGLALSLSALYAIGGEGQAAYLAAGAALAAIQGWLFFLVLRLLGLRATVAGAGAAIFVVLPVIDGARLWMSAFPIQVAGSLYLLGVLTALRGLRAEGGATVAWHCGAAILFFAAVLTYELVAGLIAVSAVLYAVRAGWWTALRRWPVDLAAIAAALAIIAPRGADDRDAVLSVGFLWDRAIQTASEGEAVFRSLLPWSEVLAGPLGLLVLLAGFLGAGVAIGRGGPRGEGFAAWVKLATIAALFALAGLAMLLPADPYFVPRLSGLGNRIGLFAAMGAVLLLIALIVLALGGLGTLFGWPRVGFAASCTLIILTALDLGVREVRQQGAWAESWTLQREVLERVDTAMDGRFPRDAAIVSFRHTTFLLPEDVSVFAYSWDLRGALSETYERPDLTARPWIPEAICGPLGMVFPDGVGPPDGSGSFEYRNLYFVDIYAPAAVRVASRADCEEQVAILAGQPPT